MKRRRFCEEQIIGLLGEAQAGSPVQALCVTHNIGAATSHAWKRKYGGMEVTGARCLGALWEENAQLRRTLAGLSVLLSRLTKPNTKTPMKTALKNRATLKRAGLLPSSASLLLLVLTALSLPAVRAADFVWIDTRTDQWTTGSNWSPEGPPSETDDAYISSGNALVNYVAGYADRLFMRNALEAYEDTHVTIQGGRLYTNYTAIGTHLGHGTPTVSVTSGDWENKGDISVGQNSWGRVNLSGGEIYVGEMMAPWTPGHVYIGEFANGVGEVNVSGGQLNVTGGSIEVGMAGQGTLTVNGDGIVRVATLNLANGTGANGVLNLGTSGTAGTLVATNGVYGNQGGTVNFHQSHQYSFGNQLSGILSVNQVGTGITILDEDNTYTGTTTVSAGTLLINGSNGPSTVTVAHGATLGGTGTIGGNTTISGTHSPGNSPGLQIFENDLTYENGATIIFEADSNTVTGRGTNFDGIDVGGNLTLNGTVTLILVFNGQGSTVDWTNNLWATDQEWLLLDIGGTTEGTLSMGLVSVDMNGVLLATVRPNASFSVTSDGQNLLVSYNAIPEPSILTFITLAGIAGLIARRRNGGFHKREVERA